MKRYIGLANLVLVFILLAGCSSLLPQAQREKTLSHFLDAPERYALFTPSALVSEEKLKVLGVEDAGEKFSRQFHLQNPILGVMEGFLVQVPRLNGTRIVQPEEAMVLPVGPEEPVLFFHSQWHFVYERIPPNFSRNQLQVGIVAKIIPIGQVRSGKGPMALKTAAWEGKCYYEPFEGKFFPLDEWGAQDGALLRQGIEDAQTYCAEKLSMEFSLTLTTGQSP